ncbi:hypothetical protein RN001_001791 [Aquatica leii]|uniref:DUF4817 domain-containing protein n=1 Tax=Aquatica leii TaxID=1421715 RepID=A0AAN7PCA0_9COLE|nr:hypothetical protein RN001_001791 [Aquatica leii]
MNFSKEELINMTYALGEAERNCLLASRIYEQKYPFARHPRSEAFEHLRERCEDTGNVKYKKRDVEQRTVTNDKNELTVLLSVEENPHVSVRQIAVQVDLSKTSIQ